MGPVLISFLKNCILLLSVHRVVQCILYSLSHWKGSDGTCAACTNAMPLFKRIIDQMAELGLSVNDQLSFWIVW